MNRAIWIFRIIGFAVLLAMTVLMLNLYTKLKRMSASSPPSASATPTTTQ